ncbi:MAG: Hsp20/alpha crystallin family protein [Thermoplasmatota archaeon]
MANGQDKRMVLRNNDRRAVSPFGPWEDIDDLFNAFRHDLDRMFFSPLTRAAPRARVVRGPNYMPMDMTDKGDRFELSIDLPGVNKEDIELSLDGDMLSISVESEEKKEKKEEGKYLFRERSEYSCSRSIRLPDEVDEEKIKANMVEGVLKVDLPKKHPEKKKKKEIKIE